MKPTDKLSALKPDNALGRIEYCRTFLYLHGFLTDSEKLKVKNRVRKWCANYGVVVESRPLFHRSEIDHAGLLPQIEAKRP